MNFFLEFGGEKLLEDRTSLSEIIATAYPKTEWIPWKFARLPNVILS